MIKISKKNKWFRKSSLWVWFVLLGVFTINPAGFSQAADMEYEVKAVFIYNFANFIDWPAETFEADNSPLRIGILGTGPIDISLMNLNGKKIQKKSLKISRVHNLNKVSQFHIIFVNFSERRNARSIIKALQGTGTLTIGDTPDFAEQCGVINFYLKGGKVRFEINVKASLREKLKISSKLLRLARIVSTQCS